MVSTGLIPRPSEAPSRTFGPASSETATSGPLASGAVPTARPRRETPTPSTTSGDLQALATQASPPTADTTDVPGTGAPPPGPSEPATTPTASASPFPSDEMAMVGDFLCLDLATARTHIEAAGLLIGVTIPSDHEPADDWIVHGQLPKAGESVPVGTNVDLVLMDPLEPCPNG